MKVRNGFVSNSSSSSFLIVGIKLKADDKKKVEEAFEAVDYDQLKKPFASLERAGEDEYFGLKHSMSDEDYDVEEIKPEDIAKVEKLLEEFFGREVKAGVFFGREAC